MNSKIENFLSDNKKEKLIIAIAVVIILLLLLIGIIVHNVNSLDDYDMSSVTFTDDTEIYDGNEHSLEIAGELPDGVSVSYTYDGEDATGETDAGTYDVVASFTGDTTEYNTISDMEATLTISVASIDTTDIKLEDASVTYDGSEHSLAISGDLPDGVSVSYTYDGSNVSGVTEVGEYAVVATLSGDDYETTTLEATLTIKEVDYEYTIDTDSDTVTLDKYIGPSTYTITTPTTITDDGTTYDVVAIGDECFKITSIIDSVKSIIISEGVTTIGEKSFYNRMALTSITLPSSLTTIDSFAFGYCTALESIEIPDGVTYIPGNCFAHCTSLATITMDGDVKEIGTMAFYYCTYLTNIVLPSSLTAIDNEAFYGCTSLESIEIPSGVTVIETDCFYSCKGLKTVTIDGDVVEIGYAAFSGCNSLTDITLPSSLTTIDGLAFTSCTSLISITIPSSVNTIGKQAFCDCQSLTNIYFEDDSAEWTIGSKTISVSSSTDNVTYLVETYDYYKSTWTKKEE